MYSKTIYFAKNIALSLPLHLCWPRSTMDSIRASEAPDSGSIPDEVTK